MFLKKLIYILALFSFIFITSCMTTRHAEQVDKKTKKLAEINIQLGMAYLEKGDIQRSKQKFIKAMEKAPQLPEVWYSMGYFLEQTGNSHAAERYYTKSVSLAPKRGDVLNNYGTYLCRSGRYAESINYFMAATKDPKYLDTASAYENAGFCALQIPNKAQAISLFEHELEEDPTRIVPVSELHKLRG